MVTAGTCNISSPSPGGALTKCLLSPGDVHLCSLWNVSPPQLFSLFILLTPEELQLWRNSESAGSDDRTVPKLWPPLAADLYIHSHASLTVEREINPTVLDYDLKRKDAYVLDWRQRSCSYLVAMGSYECIEELSWIWTELYRNDSVIPRREGLVA